MITKDLPSTTKCALNVNNQNDDTGKASRLKSIITGGKWGDLSVDNEGGVFDMVDQTQD